MDDEGAVGVDDEFDIYEDLHLEAIMIAAGAEEGLAILEGAVVGEHNKPQAYLFITCC